MSWNEMLISQLDLVSRVCRFAPVLYVYALTAKRSRYLTHFCSAIFHHNCSSNCCFYCPRIVCIFCQIFSSHASSTKILHFRNNARRAKMATNNNPWRNEPVSIRILTIHSGYHTVCWVTRANLNQIHPRRFGICHYCLDIARYEAGVTQ